jgi:hypothetical protein
LAGLTLTAFGFSWAGFFVCPLPFFTTPPLPCSS